VTFLKQAIDTLEKNNLQGKPVDGRPHLRYIQIRRRTGGHAHLAVYRIDQDSVNVLNVFHSSQNWQTQIEG
jgi:plasmid stabilization system protein ParE